MRLVDSVQIIVISNFIVFIRPVSVHVTELAVVKSYYTQVPDLVEERALLIGMPWMTQTVNVQQTESLIIVEGLGHVGPVPDIVEIDLADTKHQVQLDPLNKRFRFYVTVSCRHANTELDRLVL